MCERNFIKLSFSILNCSGSGFIPDLCEHILRIKNSNLKTPFYATFLCTNIFVKERKVILVVKNEDAQDGIYDDWSIFVLDSDEFLYRSDSKSITNIK